MKRKKKDFLVGRSITLVGALDDISFCYVVSVNLCASCPHKCKNGTFISGQPTDGCFNFHLYFLGLLNRVTPSLK